MFTLFFAFGSLGQFTQTPQSLCMFPLSCRGVTSRLLCGLNPSGMRQGMKCGDFWYVISSLSNMFSVVMQWWWIQWSYCCSFARGVTTARVVVHFFGKSHIFVSMWQHSSSKLAPTHLHCKMPDVVPYQKNYQYPLGLCCILLDFCSFWPQFHVVSANGCFGICVTVLITLNMSNRRIASCLTKSDTLLRILRTSNTMLYR